LGGICATGRRRHHNIRVFKWTELLKKAPAKTAIGDLAGKNLRRSPGYNNIRIL
jgi:hypothetical protein